MSNSFVRSLILAVLLSQTGQGKFSFLLLQLKIISRSLAQIVVLQRNVSCIYIVYGIIVLFWI